MVGVVGLFFAFIVPVGRMVFSDTGGSIAIRVTWWLGIYRVAEPGDFLVEVSLVLSLLMAISVVSLANLHYTCRRPRLLQSEESALTCYADRDSWRQGVRIWNSRGSMKLKRTLANIAGVVGLFFVFMFPVARMVFSSTGESIIGQVTSWLGIYRNAEPGDSLVDTFLLISLLLAMSNDVFTTLTEQALT